MQLPEYRDAAAGAGYHEDPGRADGLFQLHAAEGRVIGALFQFVQLLHGQVPEHVVRRAEGFDDVPLHAEQIVRGFGGKVDLVQAHDHGHAALPRQEAQDGKELGLVLDIQECRGLVQYQKLGLLGQGAGQDHPLFLSVRQGHEITLRDIRGVHQGKRILDDALVFIRHLPHQIGVGITAQTD